MEISLRLGDCRERLAELEDESMDAVIFDPPYELGFMGKDWDASGVAYDPELWEEIMRALKPGGVVKAFGGTRTFHRMAAVMERVGFVGVATQMEAWTYGSGFPKSLNISKALRKKAKQDSDPSLAKLAETWEGYGTALKPAWEPVLVAHKPEA